MDGVATGDPRRFGKLLRHQLHGYWRHYIGGYRSITKHYREALAIFAVEIMHRTKIYGEYINLVTEQVKQAKFFTNEISL